MDRAEWDSRFSKCTYRISMLKHGLAIDSVDSSLPAIQQELQFLDEIINKQILPISNEENAILRRRIQTSIGECHKLPQNKNKNIKTAIIDLQNDIVSNQDRALDQIDDQLSRVGQISTGVYGEVLLQNDMIDEIESGVGVVYQRIEDISQKSGKVLTRKKTCRYWVLICVLVIVIIILLAI